MSQQTEGIKIEDAAEEEIREAAEEMPAQEEAAAQQEETDPQTEEPQEEAEEAAAEAADDAKYLRLLAEFQNYKKRVEKEKSDLYSYANEKIMTELLEVLDNFERALQQGAGDGFEEGMKLIFSQLTNVLTKEGLAEIAALGEDFDPNVHNAVMTEETDEYESGKVSGVMQKGYTLNGKVIRPSMVKVVN